MFHIFNILEVKFILHKQFNNLLVQKCLMLTSLSFQKSLRNNYFSSISAVLQIWFNLVRCESQLK